MLQELIINEFKKKIKQGLHSNFTGLGIIIVKDSVDSLPITDLIIDEDYDTSKFDEVQLADYLLKISRSNHALHDGFHVVSLKQGLVKTSQYFSPPVPKNIDDMIYGIGARHRTAQIGSNCKDVLAVMVIGQAGQFTVAEFGTMNEVAI